ncbi:MAG: VCBS repeat-containing protein [Nanoarchaeota archaeon]|nr:VCBS repeat-containing protein [Nanoarchaeota archaeon]
MILLNKKTFVILTFVFFIFLFFCLASAQRYFSENQTWQENLTGVFHSGISFGDIDNDGDLDLVTMGCTAGGVDTCTTADKIRIYINNGITLTENSTWEQNLTSLGYGSLAFGDIDNDGDLDLALVGDVGGGNGDVRIYTNDGATLTENSTWEQNLTEIDAYAGSLAFGDIDNDGDLDLALVGANPSSDNGIYTNNGISFAKNSSWLESLPLVGYGLGSAGLAFGDIDDNGKLDLIFIGSYSINMYAKIYTNNGATLTENSTLAGDFANYGPLGWPSLTLGDYDNDGDLDLFVMGTAGGDHCTLYINNRTTFLKNETEWTGLCGLFYGSLAFGDIDNDGDLDLAANGREGATSIHINNKTDFVLDMLEWGNLEALETGSSIVLIDLDNDYDLDLIETGSNNSGIVLARVYTNNITIPNNIPLPSNSSFSSSYANNIFTLTWGNGSDTETNTSGLYYNLRVSTSSGGNNIVSGIYGGSSNPTAGYFGNMMQRKSISLNVQLQANTTYFWSVQTIDTGLAKSNWSEEQNYTTSTDITDPTITLNSPVESFNTSNATIVFNATVYDDVTLSNVTLYGNWNGWHANETNASGVNNTNYVFTKNLAMYGDGRYQWKIRACDIMSNCINSSTRNFAIDTSYPVVALVSPSNASTWTSSSTVTFTYNVTDLAIANCSLIVNNAVDQTESSITVNTSQEFTKSLSNGNYNWSVNCTDYVGYVNNSLTWKITVSYTAPSNGGSSGGGGGGGSVYWTSIAVNDNDFVNGYTKEIAKKNRLQVKVDNEYHYIGLVDLTETIATINVSSIPEQAILGIGEEKKFEVTEDNYYDLIVKLNGIVSNKANFTVKSIYEEFVKEVEEIPGKEVSEKKPEESVEEKNVVNEIKEFLIKLKSVERNKWLGLSLIIGFICLIVLLIIKILHKGEKGKWQK